jgi:hypothetical protein
MVERWSLVNSGERANFLLLRPIDVLPIVPSALDAPVTIAEIDAAVDECAKLKQSELQVLAIVSANCDIW